MMSVVALLGWGKVKVKLKYYFRSSFNRSLKCQVDEMISHQYLLKQGTLTEGEEGFDVRPPCYYS
jgi:hypothetical protein